MLPLLLATLLADVRDPTANKVRTGLPEVVIADERPEGADPNAIKITLINRTKSPITIVLGPHIHENWFTVRFCNERGRPMMLLPTPSPLVFEGAETRMYETKPGETSVYYFSPRDDRIIPPGRYRIEVVYRYRPPGRTDRVEVVSNRVTKTFP